MTKLLSLRINAVHFTVVEAINNYCADNRASWYPIGGSMAYHWQFADESVISAVLLKFADVPLRVVDIGLTT